MLDETEKRPKRPYCTLLGRSLKDEFTLSALRLDNPGPVSFSLPQWEWIDGPPYVVYRFAVALLLVIWLACEIPLEIKASQTKQPLLFFTYATEWAFILFTLTASGFAVFCAYYVIKKVNSNNGCGSRALWFFYGIGVNVILTTSGIYWLAFWDHSYTYFFTLSSKLKHSIPAGLVILDVAFSNIPIRLLHGVYPFALGIFYALFSYVYWLCGYFGINGNGIIYPLLNWNKPAYAVGACILALLFCVIIQILLYSCSFTRRYASCALGGRGVEELKSLLPEEGDFLRANEDADLLDEDGTKNTTKTYSSMKSN